jgi:hypothetical protein
MSTTESTAPRAQYRWAKASHENEHWLYLDLSWPQWEREHPGLSSKTRMIAERDPDNPEKWRGTISVGGYNSWVTSKVGGFATQRAAKIWAEAAYDTLLEFVAERERINEEYETAVALAKKTREQAKEALDIKATAATKGKPRGWSAES